MFERNNLLCKNKKIKQISNFVLFLRLFFIYSVFQQVVFTMTYIFISLNYLGYMQVSW